METTLCKKPFMVGGMLPAGCYTCPPCRVKRKKQWASRLWLESMSWKDNAFITLTYDEKNIPRLQSDIKTRRVYTDGSLIPSHLQTFLKKLRSRVSPEKLRFFLCGEYGSQTERPHYHLLLFNYQSCLRGSTDLRVQNCCPRCNMVQESWNQGKVQLGPVSEKACAYIAKYVTKGWTKLNDSNEQLLRGRQPEFIRMSLRKGIGYPAISSIHKSISDNSSALTQTVLADVPLTYRSGRTIRPFGGYLRRELRKALKLSVDGKAPEIFSRSYWEEMRKLRQKASSDPARSKKIDSWKKYVVDIGTQKWLNLEARLKLKTNQGVL